MIESADVVQGGILDSANAALRESGHVSTSLQQHLRARLDRVCAISSMFAGIELSSWINGVPGEYGEEVRP